MRIAAVLILACLSWSGAAQAAAPKTTPATAPAPKVVFLLDASGSMSNAIGSAKREIVRGVEQLPAGTPVTVITTYDGGKSKALAATLVPAKGDTGSRAATFLEDVTPTGKDGEFNEALATIARLRPSVVWFCTDGTFAGNDKSTAALTAAAKRGGYRMNVVLFGDNANREEVALRNTVAAAIKTAGGTVLNEKGEPYIPVAIAGKPAPAAPPKPKSDRPSIFQEY